MGLKSMTGNTEKRKLAAGHRRGKQKTGGQAQKEPSDHGVARHLYPGICAAKCARRVVVSLLKSRNRSTNLRCAARPRAWTDEIDVGQPALDPKLVPTVALSLTPPAKPDESCPSVGELVLACTTKRWFSSCVGRPHRSIQALRRCRKQDTTAIALQSR
jgi:hypothetical protein